MRSTANVSFRKVYFQVWNINVMILTLERNINIGYLSITNMASIMTRTEERECYRIQDRTGQEIKITPEMISPPSLLPEGAVTGASGAADWGGGNEDIFWSERSHLILKESGQRWGSACQWRDPWSETLIEGKCISKVCHSICRQRSVLFIFNELKVSTKS